MTDVTFTAFTRAGTRDGTDLYQHACARHDVAYVSARPSHPEDDHLVPGCGCRPHPADSASDVPRWVPSVPAQRIIDAGFDLGAPASGTCQCGHPFGPHQFAAMFGSPLDGGLYRCQEYPACQCSGTWGTSCPLELRP